MRPIINVKIKVNNKTVKKIVQIKRELKSYFTPQTTEMIFMGPKCHGIASDKQSQTLAMFYV